MDERGDEEKDPSDGETDDTCALNELVDAGGAVAGGDRKCLNEPDEEPDGGGRSVQYGNAKTLDEREGERQLV